MKNLFSLEELSVLDITEIIESAVEFKNGKDYKELQGKKVVNLFFENSTRTHYSFIAAEQNLGMIDTNFNAASSSVKKGESLYDTIRTFEALGFDSMVIRHPQNNYFKQLDGINVPLMNGGDGTGNHPTQSLLDLMTIYEEYGKFKDLKIAIVGDIRHSRVAHTNIKVMERLGMKVYITGPKEFDDGSGEHIEFNQAIEEMDIIMLLRVQYERHGYEIQLSKEEYLADYGLTMDKVAKMKDHAIIMHPAPFNRKTEIDDDVVECYKSRIFKQMTNGVYTRMAVLKWVFDYE
ncbi:Aspartate carbamoyltransferase [Candidatus Izimaplasma bacterium HR1]|jgi:aspartate carbamoyltransferase catalytic subunit|uniref:aspartate carbamoyltransferase catalytic subunit n=1 Tax=Candidatus Izimoplasma sp. HR1 TaxID=1541959 RepID=UPI0004F640EE|nr:Aspartate carbamoyltransferase [Candidatus Izimaplasma bacterium HR1]